jgi:hypothetical protein
MQLFNFWIILLTLGTEMIKQPVLWEKIQKKFENKKSSLWLGKGFNCAVWNRFKDSFLYQEALPKNNDNISFSAGDKHFFEALGTKNFEKVLATLSTTKVVNEILGAQAHPPILQTIDEHYQNIQRSLIQAVERVNIPWEIIPKKVLITVKEEILKYQNQFDTSYNLLIYWSLMSDGDFEGFRGYFKVNKFAKNFRKEDDWLITCQHNQNLPLKTDEFF